jgi:hypothetical protein
MAFDNLSKSLGPNTFIGKMTSSVSVESLFSTRFSKASHERREPPLPLGRDLINYGRNVNGVQHAAMIHKRWKTALLLSYQAICKQRIKRWGIGELVVPKS